MKILVHGYTGRMGQIVCRMAADGFAGAELAARVSPECPANGVDECYVALNQFTGDVDCVVDFSHHSATPALLEYCVDRMLPVVIATTGHTSEEQELIHQAAKSIPVFYSANMSVGVAVLAQLAAKAVAMFPDADIEIVEKHHNQKLDVPSGTALLLAKRIQEVRIDSSLLIGRHENGKRSKQEIGIHSLRLGNEVGTHEIIITTGNETITLKHEAENRALFAEGALTAAAFLAEQQPGLYNMQHITA